MTRHRTHRRAATALTCSVLALGLTSCVSVPEKEVPTDNGACELLRPIARDLELGQPAVSTLDDRERCTAGSRDADHRKYVTFTVTLDERALSESVSGHGKRTDLTLGGRDAVMLLGDINSGECQVFLDAGDGSSVVLSLVRNNAMTQQTCSELEPIAERVADGLGAEG
ncbi:hypothetical protein [Umezawaea beigongshangensis]|uniref:hypothetical protein n=1 Tax=Umezawaea beigongshangensis TaxID=2780383 RepID=UPI0018F1FDAD|nr:hypothetical protein [Umezawaea beigongshangensis]